MVVVFPDVDTLLLALTSGAVPEKIWRDPVEASFAEIGEVHIKSTAKLSDDVRAKLQELNVRFEAALPIKSSTAFSCWPEILPLHADKEPDAAIPQSTVLFELPDADRLPGLMTEVLRLGNDRQSFRLLQCSEKKKTALLRVQSPPYYSLLQALDRDGDENAPIAYVEKSPRIWIEAGWDHPLIGALRAPAKQCLLLRRPNAWRAVDDAPFRDIYDVVEFPLPRQATTWRESTEQLAFQVPLRLTPGGSSAPAELWVLRDSPQEQIEELIRSADERLIERLLFAVAEGNGNSIVILRARPSRQGPPVLVLRAKTFRPYQKLPNLFVPCGQRIHPPLRRDRIRDLLAADLDKLTWLAPQADGGFVPESVADQSFRPLSDWAEYVLSRDEQVLKTWIQSSLFDFNEFICTEEPAAQPKLQDDDAKSTLPADDEAAPPELIPETKEAKPTPSVAEALEALPATAPTEMHIRLKGLEEQFLAIDGPIDAPERQALWPQLAAAYAGLGNHSDAAVCLANALWEDPPDAPRWLRLCRESIDVDKSDGQIDSILEATELSTGQIRSLAVQLVGAAYDDTASPAVIGRLGRIQNLIHNHAEHLPARLVWLAAMAVSRLSGGDVLHLARTRELLLERLFATGLRSDLDMPAFLRFTGGRFRERFQTYRDWLGELPAKTRHWLQHVNRADDDDGGAETSAYADLILACGFARLGEGERSRDLLQRAQRQLTPGTDAARLAGNSESGAVHTILFEAFRYRIEQALRAEAMSGPLPAEHTEKLQSLERIPRLVVERLLQKSAILSPQENINAFRAIYPSDELDRSLVSLSAITDKRELQTRIDDLVRRFSGDDDNGRNQKRIVEASLELAPRIGEEFSVQLLSKSENVLQRLDNQAEGAGLLEKAMLIAAHFGRKELVQRFAGNFERLVQSLHEENDMLQIVSLIESSFRSLRKLGMSDWMGRLLQQLEATILQGESFEVRRNGENWPLSVCALLHVAAGWYYFDKEATAEPIVEEARLLLYRADLQRYEKKNLACALATAYSQAPPETALAGVDEMFEKLKGVFDNSLTKDYFGLWELEIVEAIVLAVVSEDFTIGGQVRRWLDEDEYLVRRRIHADMRQGMTKDEGRIHRSLTLAGHC